ncbi:unnamed protein product [Prunus armeniaca]
MLWQGENKPLREYVACYSHEYSQCPETNDRAAYGAFKSGLRESHFRYLVHNNPWNTYAELMKLTTIHVKAEYFNSKRGLANPSRSTFGDPPSAPAPTPVNPPYSASTPDNHSTHHPKRKDCYLHTFSNGKRGRQGTHHESSGNNPSGTNGCTPLLFEPKPKFKFTSHDIESCITLRNIIEELIREEKLDKYVHNLLPPPNPHQRQINMISIISGGPTLAGTSNNSIKHYVCSSYAHQVFSTQHERLPKIPKSGWAPITFN